MTNPQESPKRVIRYMITVDDEVVYAVYNKQGVAEAYHELEDIDRYRIDLHTVH